MTFRHKLGAVTYPPALRQQHPSVNPTFSRQTHRFAPSGDVTVSQYLQLMKILSGNNSL